MPETWRKGEKLEFLAKGDVAWQILTPGAEHTWLVSELAEEYRGSASIDDMFDLRSLGVKTSRDEIVYEWSFEHLEKRARRAVADYNVEVDRYFRNKSDFIWASHVKWGETLKKSLQRGVYAEFDAAKIRHSLYRPFCRRWLYFDRVLIERVLQWPKISGSVISVTDIASEKPFMVLMSDVIVDLHLVGAGAGTKCFPLSHLKDSAVAQFRQHYSDDSITKEAVFHYLYALLHHPEYRERYAANLKRELPRIPFAPSFAAFADAGRELARLHVGYESLDPWPLEEIVSKDVPYSERVIKMKLSPDKRSLRVNESLTLGGIPAEAFEYRLGSRSALEWVIDQYQVKGESDPNREDDPDYIVRLVGQVVRVSMATVRIVKDLANHPYRPG